MEPTAPGNGGSADAGEDGKWEVALADEAGIAIHRTRVVPLSRDTFAPYGEVLEPPTGDPGRDIGTGRFWDGLLPLEESVESAAIIAYHPRAPVIDRLERHPNSGQSFIALSEGRALLFVADAGHAKPGPEHLACYVLSGGSGFRIAPGTWHVSPLPLDGALQFSVLMAPGTLSHGTDWHVLDHPLAIGGVDPRRP